MKHDIKKLKRISRYILLNYKKYGIFLYKDQIAFLKYFGNEKTSLTSHQITYFYQLIAKIQNKNIQQQLKALKEKIERLEEFSKNIEV